MTTPQDDDGRAVESVAGRGRRARGPLPLPYPAARLPLAPRLRHRAPGLPEPPLARTWKRREVVNGEPLR